MDREKVIKGLEHCADRTNKRCNRTCPYHDRFFCESELAADALELVKEQTTENVCSQRNVRLFFCEKCGYGIEDIYLTDETHYQMEPIYCPNCGRKVHKEEKTFLGMKYEFNE